MAASAEELQGTNGPFHILVADDDVVNRSLLQRILEKRGHTVLLAEDGDMALGMAEREQPDLLVVDLSMPIMGGIEMLRAIRRGVRDIDADIPAIVLTGHDKADVYAECVECGVTAIITKPVVAQLLHDEVAAVMSGRAR
ncbi:response regulator [Oceanidesulfovibrio marinus]|nr:response regulator [Oceanidesulfovibrio marinus]